MPGGIIPGGGDYSCFSSSRGPSEQNWRWCISVQNVKGIFFYPKEKDAGLVLKVTLKPNLKAVYRQVLIWRL